MLIGRGNEAPVQVASAGWAAAFLAGLAMYFQVAANRAADRRLVLAGLPARRLTLARLTTGLGIAVTVTAVAVLALAARGDLTDPARQAAGTLLAAVVYLGIGAVIAVPCPIRSTAASRCCSSGSSTSSSAPSSAPARPSDGDCCPPTSRRCGLWTCPRGTRPEPGTSAGR